MVNSMKYKKVIFCSSDCTYRAPVAAEIFKRSIARLGLSGQIDVVAKGVLVMFPEPVNGKAIAIGKSRGYDLSECRASAIGNYDFSSSTVVLTMTEFNKFKIYDLFVNAINVYTVKEFLGAAGDIEIPFGKNLSAYGESFMQLEELINQVAVKIKEMNEV